MSFKAELECPQCGAPLELDEADHLLECPYCNTTNFLTAPDFLRFILPHPPCEGQMLYVPYLRFRGSVFSCHHTGIDHRVADISQLGTPLSNLPHSLGFRPQAMKMRFATPELPGIFLKNFLSIDKALAKINTYTSKTVFHQAHIGEVMSLIYLPLSLRNDTIYDAISNDALARTPGDQDIFTKITDESKYWRITTLATLCPQCGWGLTGTRNSVALSCNNCRTLWEANAHGFSQVAYTAYQTRDTDNVVFLPFWRITARSTGIRIDSLADFIRATNQPRVVQPAWEATPMRFWCPAFKIRPKIFLQLASQLTTSQGMLQENELPQVNSLHPVSLPKKEALQSLKLILANTATNKKQLMPGLPRTNFAIQDITLAYVPFADHGYNLYQEAARANINKKVLQWGDKL